MSQKIMKDTQEVLMLATKAIGINTSDEKNLIDLQAEYITDLFNTHWASVDESTAPRVRDNRDIPTID